MTGQDLTDILYMLAIPVSGNLRKVLVVAEDGELRINALGCPHIECYQRAMSKTQFAKLAEFVIWDDKTESWKVKATKKRTPVVAVGIFHNKISKAPVRKKKLGIDVLANNKEIKQRGDLMTEDEVIRAEAAELKKTGRPVTGRRYQDLKD